MLTEKRGNFTVLATDYDGTIATHGAVDGATLDALNRLKRSGRRLVMVTGREIDDLRSVFSQLELFDLIVAENGALLHWPADGRERLLASPPEPEFLDALRARNVTPLSIGRVIVATYEPFESVALEAIKELVLEYQVIFNKGSVMILPTGVNKATGLHAALGELSSQASEVVGVGDAENDHAFLEICGFSAAVANALPALKRHVDWVSEASHGAGVAELIDRWIGGTLPAVSAR